jgi:drug/metabolite transporter (DMT)-like permease
MPQKHPLVAYLILVFLCLTWGSSFILMKKGLESFSPIQVAGFRLVFAAMTLFPFIWGKLGQLQPRQWRMILLVGVVGNGLPAFLFPLAETMISSASAGILNGLSPLFALVIGQVFFGFRFSRQQNWGVMIGFVGAVVIVIRGGGELDIFDQITYSLAVVLATVCYGLSTVTIKKYLNQTPPILSTGLAFLMMAVPYGLYLLFFGGVRAVFVSDPQAWISLGYVAILGAIGTALAVYLYYRLIQMTDPIVASSVTYLIPIVALGWGLLAGESITAGQVLGMGIVLIGVSLANRKKRPSALPKAEAVAEQSP